ncbi:hypothetical protein [Aquisalibacillus elongatus]|uniref:Lipoprotein n=1 Tax=Aquisalibacillus elongatus TaxID=485577 RepID=A0A3N5B724_9BACI|nr:hypothetical protein [Aquisalibacillus elongatus]RPF53234.1 hypothetical protein EDC24_1731 [Aquisalibacillus elongatus]
MRKYVLLLSLLTLIACSPEASADDAFVTLEPLEESNTAKSTKRLALGPVMEFDLTFQDPENTKLDVWIERYHEGELFNPDSKHFRTVDENIKHANRTIGWFIVDPQADLLDMRLYDFDESGSTTGSNKFESNINSNPISHGFLIDGSIDLEKSQEYTIAVFNQSNNENSIKAYDDVDQILNNNRVVYLMKVQVEEK